MLSRGQARTPRVLIAFDAAVGGVAEQVRLLLRGLPSQGFEVELAGPADSLCYPDAQALQTPIHRVGFVGGYRRPASELAALRGLVALLRSGRFDLVHSHSSKAGVLARLAARLTGTPAIHSPHSFSFVGDFSPTRRRLALEVERTLADMAARTICVCQQERIVAREAGLRGSFPVVYNGVNACSGGRTATDPALAELRGSGLLAAAIAELRPQKSIEVLIDAAPLILERLPQARIAIVGNGPQAGRLRQRAVQHRLDGDARFAFIPFEPPAERYLHAIDLYVLPSSWEALPIGLLEALACGVPQVATDVGGNPEAVALDTGLLVPKRDPPALAEAICALLDDPRRLQSMGQASRARHAARFTAERMVAQTASVYDEVLAGKRSPT